MSINLLTVLQYLVPNARCMVWENDYGKTVWEDARPMPTREEVDAAIPAVEELENAKAVQQAIMALETAMHTYIRAHYGQEWQAYLTSAYMAPDCSVERKDACAAAWGWVTSVVNHYKGLILKIANAEELSPEEQDWPTLFDASDPGVSLLTLPD
jgi:hypothetical protein